MTTTEGRSPARRRTHRVLWIVAIGMSTLAVLLVLAAWRNDRTISSNEGFATAEVLSAGRLRSAVSYVTPDGLTHNPPLGVLYPTNLVAGQRIDVEYAQSDPDLVRVAGRDASVAVIPAVSVIVITWVVAAPLLWYTRKRS
ncbi:membrane protein [Rhodococcoides trifolii]|uniref:Membrane protein n=2 Tax=Rhodococcoides trifolii TaxID=908250 RepID=A0A917CRI8_9NOCA|nr:membrane protein [Rhodococcus trifolii]